MDRLRTGRTQIALVLRWRPEWPLAVVVLAAWVVLLAYDGAHGKAAAGLHDPHAYCSLLASEHPAEPIVIGPAPAHGPHADGNVMRELPGWTLMAVAMMAPVGLPAARHVGFNSIRARRYRAIAVYFATYVAVWIGFGMIALGAAGLARQTLGVDTDLLLAGTLAAAAAWQLTRWKRRALYGCKRTVPLPPLGLRADAGCVRFALKHGWRCLTSCWALMATMAVVDRSSVIWMAVLTAFVTVEELTVAGRRLRVPAAAVFAGGAMLVVIA
jgi:predicted metal-binding membrane protein